MIYFVKNDQYLLCVWIFSSFSQIYSLMQGNPRLHIALFTNFLVHHTLILLLAPITTFHCANHFTTVDYIIIRAAADVTIEAKHIQEHSLNVVITFPFLHFRLHCPCSLLLQKGSSELIRRELSLLEVDVFEATVKDILQIGKCSL